MSDPIFGPVWAGSPDTKGFAVILFVVLGMFLVSTMLLVLFTDYDIGDSTSGMNDWKTRRK